jgi:hypothetical protein
MTSSVSMLVNNTATGHVSSTPPPPGISLPACLIKETASHYFTAFPIYKINIYILKLVLKATRTTFLSEAFLTMLFKAFFQRFYIKKFIFLHVKIRCKLTL